MTDLSEILNWRRWNESITLSGQPMEEQLGAIRDLRVTHVINLGPHTNKGALEDEAGSVSALGMAYIYIPVDFENLTDGDFTHICEAARRWSSRDPCALHLQCPRICTFLSLREGGQRR